MRKPVLATLSLVTALVVMVGWSNAAHAYEVWSDGCDNCHGDFRNNPYSPASGGADWADSLHNVHRDSAFMNSDCELCHTTGGRTPVYLGSSDGTVANTGVGCVGCHTENGLQLHHINAGETICSGCHTPGAAPAESVSPPYYGSVDTNVDVPCNDDTGTSEDWSGDGVGLDNDGDQLYDSADSDCGVAPICGDANVDAGEDCDGVNLDGADCVSQGCTGGVLTCDGTCSFVLAACTGCGGPVCGDDVVDTGEECDGANLDGETCVSQGCSGGTLACDGTCGFDLTGCTDCTGPVCGDDVVDTGEECDGANLDGETCVSQGCSGGTLACDGACGFDLSGCTDCGTPNCVDNDGTCPTGCDESTDNDCATADDGGCGCTTNSSWPSVPGFILLLFVGLFLSFSRRRRK